MPSPEDIDTITARIKAMKWNQFVALVEKLGMDVSQFSEVAAPAAWWEALKGQMTALGVSLDDVAAALPGPKTIPQIRREIEGVKRQIDSASPQDQTQGVMDGAAVDEMKAELERLRRELERLQAQAATFITPVTGATPPTETGPSKAEAPPEVNYDVGFHWLNRRTLQDVIEQRFQGWGESPPLRLVVELIASPHDEFDRCVEVMQKIVLKMFTTKAHCGLAGMKIQEVFYPVQFVEQSRCKTENIGANFAGLVVKDCKVAGFPDAAFAKGLRLLIEKTASHSNRARIVFFVQNGGGWFSGWRGNALKAEFEGGAGGIQYVRVPLGPATLEDAEEWLRDERLDRVAKLTLQADKRISTAIRRVRDNRMPILTSLKAKLCGRCEGLNMKTLAEGLQHAVENPDF